MHGRVSTKSLNFKDKEELCYNMLASNRARPSAFAFFDAHKQRM